MSSEIERVEDAIVERLAPRLGSSVRVEVHPDDPDNWDFAGAAQAVLVHFSQSQPAARSKVRLAGRVGFSVIVLARSLRGPGGGYALLENVEQALAGMQIPGAREVAVIRSRLDSQSGGTWRWVVDIETELTRGRVNAVAQPFIESFQESDQ